MLVVELDGTGSSLSMVSRVTMATISAMGTGPPKGTELVYNSTKGMLSTQTQQG